MTLKKSLSCRGLGLPFSSLAEVAKSASETGFEALDLPLKELWQNGVKACEVRSIMNDHGLQPGASPFPFVWRDSQTDFINNLEHLQPFLDYSMSIGVKRIYTRVSESVPPNESATDTIAWHHQRLALIAMMLKKSNIMLGLETVGVSSFRQGRQPIMPNLKSVRQHLSSLFEEFENLGLLIDVFHLYASSESIDDAIGPLNHRIVGVHVADLPDYVTKDAIIDHQRALPGTSGIVPVQASLFELASRNINAPVIIETVQNCFVNKSLDFNGIVRTVSRSIKSVWPVDH